MKIRPGKNSALAEQRNRIKIGVPPLWDRSWRGIKAKGSRGGRAFHFAYRNSGDSESPEFRGSQAARAAPWNPRGTERCPSAQHRGHGGRLVPAKKSKIRTVNRMCAEFSKGPPSFFPRREARPSGSPPVGSLHFTPKPALK